MSVGHVQVIGVIGCGRMGRKLAQTAAVAGFEVRLLDGGPGRASQARAVITKRLEEEAAAGRLPRHSSEETASRLRVVNDLQDLADADCVLEMIPEDPVLKRKLLTKVDAILPPTTLLASGSSTLSVGKLAEGLRSAGRMLGMHFFNASQDAGAVEVVLTPATNDQAVVNAMALASKLGRVPLKVSDSPGFIGNRVHLAFCLEALRLLESGLGDMQAIDAAARGVGGHAHGPFESMDRQGLDAVLRLVETIHGGLEKAARFTPPALLRRLTAAEQLGREGGRGFYEYSGSHMTPAYETPPRTTSAWAPSPALRELAMALGKPVDRATWLFGRMLLAAINESALVADSIALPRDVNLAMELAFGFPEGPLALADRVGLDVIHSVMADFYQETGESECFKPCPLLGRLLAAGHLGEKTARGFLYHAL